jgi:hypothetical protein
MWKLIKVNVMSFPAQPTNLSIPTRHELLRWEQVDDFSSWLDEQLKQLERDHAGFVTRESCKLGVKGVSRGSGWQG